MIPRSPRLCSVWSTLHGRFFGVFGAAVGLAAESGLTNTDLTASGPYTTTRTFLLTEVKYTWKYTGQGCVHLHPRPWALLGRC